MKPSFKLPDRKVDEWVAGGGEGTQSNRQEERPLQASKLKPARLTIDLEPSLHAKFKAACALNATDMVTEVRQFIVDWTQKHS